MANEVECNRCGKVSAKRTDVDPGLQTPTKDFRRPSDDRSEQFARKLTLEAARRSETELIETIVACA